MTINCPTGTVSATEWEWTSPIIVTIQTSIFDYQINQYLSMNHNGITIHLFRKGTTVSLGKVVLHPFPANGSQTATINMALLGVPYEDESFTIQASAEHLADTTNDIWPENNTKTIDFRIKPSDIVSVSTN